MVVLQRSLDKSVQHTLRLLLLSLGSVLLMSVAALFGTAYVMTGQMRTVYADRLVPLDDLQAIDRLLIQGLPAALVEAQPMDGVPSNVVPLKAAKAELRRLWSKYMATYLTPEEVKIAEAVDGKLAALEAEVLSGRQGLLLKNYQKAQQDLSVDIKGLMDLQIDVAKSLLQQAQLLAKVAAVCGLGLALLGLGLIVLAVRIMSGHIVQPLHAIASSIAELAGGRTEALPSSQSLSGDFAEVGDQLRNLRTYIKDRQRLIQLEQARLQQLQQAQAELVEAEKLASLGGLVAGVAHELNTPIGVAVAVASGLADKQQRFQVGLAAGPLRRSMLDGFMADVSSATQILERNLARAAEMVRSFKQVAVDRSGMQRRRFDLQQMADELLASLRPVYGRRGAELINALPAGIELDSYPGALGQVLSNLFANAVLHGLGERAGVVRLELLPMPAKEAGRDAEPDCLEICVSDDGEGMSAEVQAKAFEPFYTTRMGQGGSGLGLPIVRNLVMGVLGGRISLSSSPGQGSRFVIQLPRVAPLAKEDRAQSRWEVEHVA